jgi:hypothetical protein
MDGRVVCAAVSAIALVASAAPAAAAAAGPVKGARYTGLTARGSDTVTLKVARTGRSVSVSIPAAPVFCARPAVVQIQKSTPARISKKGTFKGTIAYEGLFTTGVTAKVYYQGRFNGKRATGTVRSEFLQVTGCNGSTSFAAKKQ